MYTFYFEVSDSCVKNFPGKYLSFGPTDKGLPRSTFGFGLALQSDRIWRQGPKGGVKLQKCRDFVHTGYVTNDSEIMKEFLLVKLGSISI